jgi:hypothetical protein
MTLLLALLPPAVAVPKAFGETPVLVAVAPDGHRVLLGSLGSFQDLPAMIVERDVAGGAEHSASDAVTAALVRCRFTAPCDALGAAWVPGAWLSSAWHDGSAAWELAAYGADGWDEQRWASCGEEGGTYTECVAGAGNDHVRVCARAGELVVSLDDYPDDMSCVGCAKILDRREVKFRAGRLRALGVTGVPRGTVVWGTEGVLVAVRSEDADGMAPVLAFVLPRR